jgi:hypothetical protein
MTALDGVQAVPLARPLLSVAEFADWFRVVGDNVRRAIRGKDEVVDLALTCLLAEGHLLIEDVPGVGKTSIARALAVSLGAVCNRIPDTQATASVRYTVATSQASGSEVRTFNVAQQDYQGWYELPAIFSIGTPDRRTGSVWVRMAHQKPADGGPGAQCPGGVCPSMAASQVEFAWS